MSSGKRTRSSSAAEEAECGGKGFRVTPTGVLGMGIPRQLFPLPSPTISELAELTDQARKEKEAQAENNVCDSFTSSVGTPVSQTAATGASCIETAGAGPSRDRSLQRNSGMNSESFDACSVSSSATTIVSITASPPAEDERQEADSQVVTRKRKRYVPQSVPLSMIRRAQLSVECVKNGIPLLPFQRLVREVAQDVASLEYKFQASAIGALHMASDAYLVELYVDSSLATTHRKRLTMFPRDLQLARRLRGDWLKF